MDWLLEKFIRYPLRSTLVAVPVLLIASGLLWWQFIWQSPQRVFEDMLANNLTAMSVTKHAVAGNGSLAVVQDVRLELGSMNAADWLVTAKQSGSTVTTESIGTPNAGYIRYIAIQSSQKSTTGKPYDFSRVLNKWAKSDGKTDPALSDVYSQGVLDIASAPTPPIGNLPVDKRTQLLTFMQGAGVFTPEYSSVKRETINGRAVYTYTVQVNLSAYIRLMQGFAQDLGLATLDTLDPSQYSTVGPVDMSMSVDRVSHQLAQIAYSGSGFIQTYRDWGLLTPVALPAHSETTTALQAKVSALGVPQT